MDEITRLLIDLMAFRTTEDNPTQIRKCADYIKKNLNIQGIIVREYVRNGKISIVALFSKTKSTQIFFNAHFDIVSASEKFYKPKLMGNKLHGRGSEDCKAQVAALVHLMRHFAKQKIKPNIGIMLTSDEEIRGNDGVKYLLYKAGYSCEFALVADGGDDWNIVTKHKGVLQVRLSSIGKSAHASRYWEGGENAIEKLVKAYSEVQKLFPKLKSAAWRTTANLSKFQAGGTINMVPDYAELYLDIRYTEKDSEKKIIGKLKGIKGIQVKKIAGAGNLITNKNNPYIRQLKVSAEKILKQKIKTFHEHGATDARYFSAKGIPAILFKPLGFGAHSEREYVLVSTIKPFFDILVDFVNKTAK